MNFSSSQHISQHTVQPVSESAHLPANSTPGSASAYHSVHNEEMDKREGDQRNTESKQHVKKETENREDSPEIFKLLEKYNFKDFFRLSLGASRADLSEIIKSKRASRGVSQSQPISEDHNQHSNFINRIASQYLASGWLMEAKPGQTYSGAL